MVIKMVALGIFGQKCYLGDTWNRLDFFIVMAGSVTISSLYPESGKIPASHIHTLSWLVFRMPWEAESPKLDFLIPTPKPLWVWGGL